MPRNEFVVRPQAAVTPRTWQHALKGTDNYFCYRENLESSKFTRYLFPIMYGAVQKGK